MKTKNKVIVYLDTSDFARLYKNSITNEEKRVRTYLERKVNEEKIIIPNSYPLMVEFIQDFSDKFEHDRLARAKLIKKLCRDYAFEFIPKHDSSDCLNKHGVWTPRCNTKADKIFKDLSLELERHPQFNIFAKDILHPRKRILLVKNHPYIFNSQDEMRALSNNSLIEHLAGHNYLVKLISKKISIQDFNRRIEGVINDPEHYVSLVHRVNPLLAKTMKEFHQISIFIEEQIKNLETLLATQQAKIKELNTQRKQLLSSALSKKEKNKISDIYNALKKQLNIRNLATTYCKKNNSILPMFLYKVLDAYFYAHLINPSLRWKKSDTGDITHALFIPHTDLWRGDKSFCNILIENDIDHKSKIVPSLLDLPGRIESYTK